MASLHFETLTDPPGDRLEPVSRGLDQYNRSVIGDYTYSRIAVLAHDDEGRLVGGVYGDLLWDWLYIQTLWVDPGCRGQDIGARLVQQIEQAARAQGVMRAHLETTSFQALGFYQKLGYEVFGVLPDKPMGHDWYYLKKDNLAGPDA